jgi:hypothetical protein
MRAESLIVVAVGLLAAASSVAAIVRWRNLPTRSTPIVVPDGAKTRTVAFTTASWSIAAVLSAGAVAGLVVGGLVGRLIMRIAAAVSEPEVQGRLTDADEVIGEVTLSGTAGFVVFVGLFGGVVAAGLYLLIRPWVPRSALATGSMVGVVVLGALGPGDPLDVENVDFALLSYDALVVALIVATALLFGVTFAVLAARFDELARSSSRLRSLLLLAFALVLVAPVGAVVALYLAGRTMLPGAVARVLDRRPVQIAGRAVLSLVVVASSVRLAVAAADIVRL